MLHSLLCYSCSVASFISYSLPSIFLAFRSKDFHNRRIFSTFFIFLFFFFYVKWKIFNVSRRVDHILASFVSFVLNLVEVKECNFSSNLL